MLANKDMYSEIQKVEKFLETAEEGVDVYTLKMLTLVLKMLYSIRANQVRMMEKVGIQVNRTKRTDQPE